MIAEPLVSIMIPAHKPGRLAQTLASALDQDWPNLEIVISDDSAGDEIAKLVAPHGTDSRVRYSRHPKPSGIVANYQRLLQLARGDWGLYLDDDDLLYPRAIETLWRAATGDRGIVLAYAGYDLVDLLSDRQRRLCPGGVTEVRAGTDFFRRFCEWPPTTISVLFAVAAARESRIFSDLPNIKSGDWEAWLRIALHGKVASVPVVTGCHFRHEASYSAIPSLPMDLHNAMFIERAADYASERGAIPPPELSRWRRRTLAWYLTWTFSQHIAGNSRAEICRELLGVLRNDTRVGLRLIGNPALCGALALSPFPGAYRNVRDFYRRLRFGPRRAPNF